MFIVCTDSTIEKFLHCICLPCLCWNLSLQKIALMVFSKMFPKVAGTIGKSILNVCSPMKVQNVQIQDRVKPTNIVSCSIRIKSSLLTSNKHILSELISHPELHKFESAARLHSLGILALVYSRQFPTC